MPELRNHTFQCPNCASSATTAIDDLRVAIADTLSYKQSCKICKEPVEFNLRKDLSGCLRLHVGKESLGSTDLR